MVNWIGNEVDQWYIDGLFLYILMGNRLSINLVTSRRGLQVVYSQMNWKKPRRLRLFEDETAEFLLFAERKNICLYPETCREIGEKIEESLRGGKIVKSFQIFECIIIEFGFRMMWRIMPLPRWITVSSINAASLFTSYSASFNTEL